MMSCKAESYIIRDDAPVGVTKHGSDSGPLLFHIRQEDPWTLGMREGPEIPNPQISSGGNGAQSQFQDSSPNKMFRTRPGETFK